MNISRRPDNSDRVRGRELARLRKAVDLTQKQVALLLHISEKQYGKYERGQTRLSATRYEMVLRVLREDAGVGGFEESQSSYDAAPKPEKDALLRSIGQLEDDLDSLHLRMRDQLKLYREIVGRL